MTVIASRVAAKYLRAEQQEQGQQQQAMPKSDVGRKMVTEALAQVEKAFEAGDDKAFHTELEKLNKAAGGISK
jgi:hypothetical protein